MPPIFISHIGRAARAVIQTLASLVAPEKNSIRDYTSTSAEKLTATLPAAPFFTAPSPLFSISAYFAYADSRVKEIVWEIKYRKHIVLAEKVGELIWKEISERAAEDSRRKILLVPIASSKKRRRERGFNQCEVICEAIMRHDVSEGHNTAGRFSYEPQVLEKIKNTAHQADLPREERLKNIIGSYTVLEPEKIRGAIVYLVDDVVTTGATMKEAANVLRAAGAAQIRGFAIAH
jgi:ComF family protein